MPEAIAERGKEPRGDRGVRRDLVEDEQRLGYITFARKDEA